MNKDSDLLKLEETNVKNRLPQPVVSRRRSTITAT